MTMKTIPLTQGKVALVDDADYAAVSQFKWYAKKCSGSFYAARGIRRPGGTWTHQYLHQFLMPDIAEIDHINGDKLNNQRENLRPASHQQNMQGFLRKRLGATSKFRGVSWCKRTKSWQVQIEVDNKTIHLGRFSDEEDAGRARDKATLKYYGDGAYLNFPDSSQL